MNELEQIVGRLDTLRVAAGDRKRLEHLLRYAERPAIAQSRLHRTRRVATIEPNLGV